MRAGLMVELDLPLLELPLPGLQAYLVERLDGILDVRMDVHGCVDDTIGADAKDTRQLQSACEELP